MNPNQKRAAVPLSLSFLFTLFLFIAVSGARGFVHNINPVLLKTGILEVRYYGLVYFLGFLTIYLVLARHRAARTLPFRADQVEALMMIGILSMLAGARLFEVLFYDPARYLNDPLEIFRIWNGGLSFHGALAGVVLSSWLFTRNKPVDFLALTDVLVVPIALLLSLGRLANFINGELYGTVTTLPWGVKFPGAEGFRHPAQIYEALKNLYIFGGLFWIRSFNPKRGTLTFLFLIFYGALRFVVELLKNYSQYHYKTLESPLLNMGQLLCLMMIGAGVAGFLMRKRTEKTAGQSVSE